LMTELYHSFSNGMVKATFMAFSGSSSWFE